MINFHMAKQILSGLEIVKNPESKCL